MSQQFSSIARREFLKFLAASPYVAAAGGVGEFIRLPEAAAQTGTAAADLIKDPASALNVFDFEEAAHRKVMPGHWAYMASGVDDDATLRANREIFKQRAASSAPAARRDTRRHARRIVRDHVQQPDIPVSDGRRTVISSKTANSRWRARRRRAARCNASRPMTSTPIEDVNKALGRPVWYQLYAPSKWAACEQLLRRVAGGRFDRRRC